jgi:hypothetical protein
MRQLRARGRHRSGSGLQPEDLVHLMQMPRISQHPPLAVLLLLISSASAAGEAPLFAAAAPLELTLELPFSAMRRSDRGVEHAGALRIADGTRLQARFAKRGHSRLESCDMPPLWMNLAGGDTEGSVFEGQQRLKLVSPCKDSRSYEQLVVSEYLNYRILNLISDMSYRVRSARMTYIDSDYGYVRGPYFGFVIEHKHGFSARTGLQPVDSPEIQPGQLDPEWAVRFEVFAYMVSHTDWSIVKGTRGDDCCHNAHLFAPPGWEGALGEVVPVGYDFDLSGSVNPPYGVPPLNLRSWKQRRYRGRCWDGDLIDQTLEEVRGLENDIRRLVLEEPAASERRRNGMWGFIAGFFEIAADPEKRQKAIHERCRPLP